MIPYVWIHEKIVNIQHVELRTLTCLYSREKYMMYLREKEHSLKYGSNANWKDLELKHTVYMAYSIRKVDNYIS